MNGKQTERGFTQYRFERYRALDVSRCHDSPTRSEVPGGLPQFLVGGPVTNSLRPHGYQRTPLPQEAAPTPPT
ncbi:hypothetical protein EF902_10020, partial [Streptomyces sp. WAC05858]